MCSIAEDDFGDEGGSHAMEEDVKLKTEQAEICKKCKTSENIVGSSMLCFPCFNQYARHKFRATLGCTKIVKRNSKVLLHFSGNSSSVALQDMIRFAFELESQYKRLCFDMDLIFVDEHCVNPKVEQNAQRRFEKIQEIVGLVKQFPNFKCFYASIGAKLTSQPQEIQLLTMESMKTVIENEANFLKTFKSISTGLSSKQDLLLVKRNEVLRKSAALLECQYVFLADISTTMASRLLTNMSLGRGSSVAYDVAFCDDRVEDVKFVRPLKDLSADEVDYYIKWNDLECVDGKGFGDDDGQFASIQNATSKFIYDLQQNFPSTVSTVYRTCGKIAPIEKEKPVEAQNVARCSLCKAHLDYATSESLHAIALSRYVSQSVGNKDYQSKAEEETAKPPAQSQLCHGCRSIFIGLSDDELKEIF